MSLEIEVTCPVFNSFRVQQIAGMFDVPLAERASERFKVDIPDDVFKPIISNPSSPIPNPSTWQIGLIVGPSGSGKTTIAHAMFPDHVYRPREWPTDQAVIDGLGPRPIKEIIRLFTAVGFSSPPSWIKPYQVLSNGEQFRCDLARALAGDCPNFRGDCPNFRPSENGTVPLGESSSPHSPPLPLSLSPHLVAFDEFTSVVDRNVARVVSAAVSRGIRSGQIACRLVAVTCHDDIADWLAPDWIIDMATGTFTRRCLRRGDCPDFRPSENGTVPLSVAGNVRDGTLPFNSALTIQSPNLQINKSANPLRPPIRLEIFRCGRAAWRLFARHHYLSGALPPYARCFLATWQGVPVAFCATLALIGRKNHWRISRIVTLPDYQGIGIGTAVAEAVAELHVREGNRVNVTASHPALLSHCHRSPRWRFVRSKKAGHCNSHHAISTYRGSPGRAVVSFEFVPTCNEMNCCDP
jgi:GNAT superfamily N-acetyltransferase